MMVFICQVFINKMVIMMSYNLAYSKLDSKMNKLYTSLVIFLSILLGPNAYSLNQEVKRITLDEAIALALRYNRTIETAYLNRLTEKFDLKVAQDKFHPDLYISSSISQASNEKKDSLNSQIGAEGLLTIPTGGQFSLAWTQSALKPWQNSENGDNFNNDLILSFKQPLLKGGGVDVNQASQVIAMRQEQENLLNLKETLINTITQVIRTYRNFLLSQRNIEISRLSLERSKNLLETNRILIAEGRLARVEIIQTESDLANQEFSFQENKNTLDSNRLQLLQLLDIDRNTLVEPVESIQVKEIKLDENTLQQTAFTNQPNYLQALLSHENSQTRLLLAKNNKLWELDVQARYNVSGSSDSWIETQKNVGNLGEGDYSVGLSLRIPFGDYTLEQEVVRAKVGFQQSKINLIELTENIKIAITDAVRSINMRWKQVKLAQKALKLSEKKLEIELEKLKVNLSTNFKVVSFQNDLVIAENNEISTKVNYLNALTDLDKFLGITLERWGVQIQREIP